MAEIAMWIMGGLLVYAGVHTMVKGMSITKDKVIKGTPAVVIGVVIILIGIGLAVGATIYLRQSMPNFGG